MLENLVAMYEDAGMSLREISDLTGLSRNAIRNRLLKAGVKLRSRAVGNERRTNHKAFIETAFMYERLGLTCREIGEHLGLAKTTVLYRLRRHGTTMRSGPESLRLRRERER